MRLGWIEVSPALGGGSEAIALDLARGLADRGHEIVLFHEEDGALLKEYRGFACGVLRVSIPQFSRRRLISRLPNMWRLAREVRRMRCDRLFTSNVHRLGTLAMLRLMGMPPSVVHLGIEAVPGGAIEHWPMRWLGAGVCPSKITALSWRKWGWPEGRLHVVSNWVDRRRMPELPGKLEARSRLGLPHGGGIILFLGRLVQEKGVHTLVRAFARLMTSHPHAHLVCVGRFEPYYEPIIRNLIAELRLPQESSILPGRSDDPWMYLRAADLLVLPSEWAEPFGLTPLEAIIAGTLPIVSSAGFLPEMVGPDNADLVFSAGDADALARLLVRWLTDSEEKTARIEALRERVTEKFNPERGVEAYERILLAAR